MDDKGNPEKLSLPKPAHVCYVTRDLERTARNLEKYLGLEPFARREPELTNKRYYGKPEDFKFRIAFSKTGDMVYELVQAIGGKTIYEDFIKEHGEGMHHLGYEISDLQKWIEAYRKIGVEPIMSADIGGGRFAYFNTPEIIVELIERPQPKTP